MAKVTCDYVITNSRHKLLAALRIVSLRILQHNPHHLASRHMPWLRIRMSGRRNASEYVANCERAGTSTELSAARLLHLPSAVTQTNFDHEISVRARILLACVFTDI